MKKSLQNLERLHLKLQARYGAEDTLVQQLQIELARKREADERAQHWRSNYQRCETVRARPGII